MSSEQKCEWMRYLFLFIGKSAWRGDSECGEGGGGQGQGRLCVCDFRLLFRFSCCCQYVVPTLHSMTSFHLTPADAKFQIGSRNVSVTMQTRAHCAVCVCVCVAASEESYLALYSCCAMWWVSGKNLLKCCLISLMACYMEANKFLAHSICSRRNRRKCQVPNPEQPMRVSNLQPFPVSEFSPEIYV